MTAEFGGMIMKVTDTAGLDDGLDMQVSCVFLNDSVGVRDLRCQPDGMSTFLQIRMQKPRLARRGRTWPPAESAGISAALSASIWLENTMLASNY